jgi:iron complex outermembrane receptor protein
MIVHKKKPIALILAHAIGVGAFVAVPAVALAQQADAQKVERVTITGSNIPRTDIEGPAPVQIITREEIERSGRQTISEIIHMLPSDNNGTVPSSFQSGFAHGATGVSLRGLSVNSTLVLVNGYRMATYGLGDDGQRSFVDLNTIPLDAVERVEVLKDGASAIYGSDAIAGVVNVILRKDYKGATASVDYGTSYKHDGDQKHLSGTLGFGDLNQDGYNFFLNVEGRNQDAISAKTRPSYIGTNDLTSQGYGDSRPGGYPFDGQSLGRGSPQGTYLDLNTGDALRGQATCPPANIDANGLCRWSTKDYEQLQPEVHSTNLFGRLTKKISNDLEAFLELGLFDSKNKSLGTPSPTRATVFAINSNSVISQAIDVAAAGSLAYNPFSPSGGAATGANIPSDWTIGDPIRYYGATTDVGPRAQEDNSRLTRFVVGLKGTNANWDWNAAAGDITSKLESTLRGYLNYTAFSAAVLNGDYLPGGSNSAAVLAAVAPALTTNSKSESTFFSLNGTHEFAQLAGGPLSIALGTDFRREKVDSPAVPGTGDGTVLGLGYSKAVGSRDITAIYAEISVPLAKTFEVSLAARTDHYSDYGNSTTPKVGAKWTPIKELAIRGTYSEGFRAPNFSENGSSATAGYVPSFTDPVRCPGGTAVPGATGACSINVGVVTTGNPSIQPEKSKSYTFGTVFEPNKHINVALDYYHIVRSNEIVQIDPNVWASNPSAFPGVTAIRDTTVAPEYAGDPGPLLALLAPYVNATKTVTNGVDFDLRNMFDLGTAGKLTTDLNITQLIKFERTNSDGSISSYAGNHGPVQMSSGAGMPKTRATLAINWDIGATSVTGRFNYRSRIRNTDGAAPQTFGDLPVPEYTASFTTFDLFGSYKIDKNWQVSGSVTNLFNRLAPLDLVAYANQNFNGTYDMAGAIGRYYNVAARYTWK